MIKQSLLTIIAFASNADALQARTDQATPDFLLPEAKFKG
jgi:hypothetical protein